MWNDKTIINDILKFIKPLSMKIYDDDNDDDIPLLKYIIEPQQCSMPLRLMFLHLIFEKLLKNLNKYFDKYLNNWLINEIGLKNIKYQIDSINNLLNDIDNNKAFLMTVNQLKQSWTVAPAKALSNCSVSVTWVKETSVLVKLVPTLAPITIGMAVLTSSTEIKYISEIDSILVQFSTYFHWRPWRQSLKCKSKNFAPKQ